MPTVLHYAELESNRVESLLADEGELVVSLPQNHAKALVSFIEITRTVQSHEFKQSSFFKRLAFLPKGLLVTATLLFGHSRLLDLSSVIVLNSRSQIWEQQPNSDVLFTFKS